MSDEITLNEFANKSNDLKEDSNTNKSQFWAEIPNDWRLIDGSDAYSVNPNPDPVQQPNTYIEMDALDTELPFPDYFGERNASEYSGKTFSEGDTLFARITPCTENGKAAIVPEMNTKVGIGSTEFAVLSPKSDVIHPWLLYYLSKSHPVHNYAVSRMRGSTGRQRVPFDVFRRELDLPIPPLSEQQKIATVLLNIDKAIQKTEKIVESIERAKRGVLQDTIFDIDSEESVDKRFGPKVFNIPEYWRRVRLQEVTSLITRGKQPTYADEGVPVINQECIYWDGFHFENIRYLEEKEAREWKDKYFVSDGDILINSTGKGTLGRAQTYADDIERAVDSHVTIVRPDTEKMTAGYFRYFLESNRGQGLLYSMCVTGSTGQIELSKSKLQLLSIPLPPKEEQKEIVNTLKQFDRNVRKQQSYKNHLSILKKGLLQDLLSGKVRTAEVVINILSEIEKYG